MISQADCWSLKNEIPLIELVELIFDDIEISCRQHHKFHDFQAKEVGIICTAGGCSVNRESNYKTLLAVPRIPRWRVGA